MNTRVMRKLFVLMLAFFVFGIGKLYSQVIIGGQDDPHAGAVLELRSGGTKGFLLPRIHLGSVDIFGLDESFESTAEEAEGMIVYNLNKDMIGGSGKGVYVWDGERWSIISGGRNPGNVKIPLALNDGNTDAFAMDELMASDEMPLLLFKVAVMVQLMVLAKMPVFSF